MYKQSMARLGRDAAAFVAAPRIEYPQPKMFEGKREAKDVENFLWQIEVYFEGVNILEEGMKVRIATMYLSDTAELWWRRKLVEVESHCCGKVVDRISEKC